MAVQLIKPAVATTKEQRVASEIDSLLQQAAVAQQRAYDGIRQKIYANPQFRKAVPVTGGLPGQTAMVFDPEAAYAAFQANTEIGATADQLGKMARLAKAAINFFQPGAISDPVPEATITF